MAQKRLSGGYDFLRIASTFGLSLAANIYLIGILLGGYIDRKLNTSPLFLIIFLFLALGMSFATLFKQIQICDERNKKRIEAEEERED